MNADRIIQQLATEIYATPLSNVRHEGDYPNLANPLHLTTLLLDFDTEIEMDGMLGFLENSTGRHLNRTIESLKLIGAPKSAAHLESVRSCMVKHGVTWERLRSEFAGTAEYEITWFHKLHGEALDSFAEEIGSLSPKFSLFNTHYSLEDCYAALCLYLEGRVVELRREIEKRKGADK